jgi:glycosyltransferase involved in cell wall biosynthesis
VRGYNIFRIAADYPVGGKPAYGLQPNFYYLSKEQERLGNHVQIIARRSNSQPRSERDGDIEICRVDSPFNVNAYRMLRDLASRMQGDNALVHTHSTSGLILGAMKTPLHLPLFAHIHGASRSSRMPQKLRGVADQDFSQSKMWYYYFRERLLWSSADRVLAVSNALKEDLISRYAIPDSKIKVVYNGVDTRIFRRLRETTPEELMKFEGKKIVLYVGHFGPRKGLIFLIRAMKEIVREVPDAVVVAIGGVPAWLGREKDYWSFLQNAIKEGGLEEKILLIDRVPNEALPAYYSKASVFVLPSFYEAFAKVVLEAMACEDPVVVTREGGPSEAIDEGKTGLLVEYGSTKELANAVIAVLQDERRARQMGIDARKRIEGDFTWESVAKRVNSAYDEVFAERV